jgi:hypothetical protein
MIDVGCLETFRYSSLRPLRLPHELYHRIGIPSPGRQDTKDEDRGPLVCRYPDRPATRFYFLVEFLDLSPGVPDAWTGRDAVGCPGQRTPGLPLPFPPSWAQLDPLRTAACAACVECIIAQRVLAWPT